jgi:predicted dehydrogenase
MTRRRDDRVTGSPAGATAAIIGCGVAGRLHADAYRRIDRTTLVGVCDVDPGRADETGAAFGVPAYHSVAELLVDQSPDFVSVTTHEAHHVEPAVAALASGANVLCEKIMTHSLEGGRILRDAVARASGRFGVSYNYRQIPRIRAIREAIRSGRLGPLTTVTVEANALCWHHALDLVIWMLGPIDSTVAASGDSVAPIWIPRRSTDDFFYQPDPSVAAVLRTTAGVLVTISSTPYRSLTDQMIQLDLTSTTLRLELRDMRIDNANGRVTAVDAHGGIPDILRDLTGAESERALDFDGETFFRSVRAFVEAVTDREEIPCSVEDGWNMLVLEAAIRRAATEGRSVRLDEIV